MAIEALVGLDGARSRKGGGLFYIHPYNSAKLPYQPHASLDTAYATGTALSCYRAPVADTHVPVSFGASGALDVDIFPGSGYALESNKAFSALGTNDFTLGAALAGAHPTRAVVKLYSASDYDPDDWVTIGYLGGTKLRLKHSDEDDKDERGVVIAVTQGERIRELVMNVKQSSKHEIDFFEKEAPGNYYAGKYVVPVGESGTQIIVVAKGAFVCDAELAYDPDSNRVVPVTFKFLTVGTDEPYVVYEG